MFADQDQPLELGLPGSASISLGIQDLLLIDLETPQVSVIGKWLLHWRHSTKRVLVRYFPDQFF